HVGHGHGVTLGIQFGLPQHFPRTCFKRTKRLSLVPPINTTPPAVTIGPPCPNAPVLWMPAASSSSVTPSGTRHAISPLSPFTAISSAQGGFWHGSSFFGSQ